jgi:hypothetical protein
MHHPPDQCCIEIRHNVMPIYIRVSSYAPASGQVKKKKFEHLFTRPLVTTWFMSLHQIATLPAIPSLHISYTDYSFYHFS